MKLKLEKFFKFVILFILFLVKPQESSIGYKHCPEGKASINVNGRFSSGDQPYDVRNIELEECRHYRFYSECFWKDNISNPEDAKFHFNKSYDVTNYYYFNFRLVIYFLCDIITIFGKKECICVSKYSIEDNCVTCGDKSTSICGFYGVIKLEDRKYLTDTCNYLTRI
uniref:Astacin domain-containing protein n=1 Tax=Parastrongyloides trichosuri TaxID=131310 RepID=A0A0N5A7J5_PARTI